MNTPKHFQWVDPIAVFTHCDPQDLLPNPEAEGSTTPRTDPQQHPPRFILGQEVFILDKSSSDPTGLTTYMVLTNHEKDAAGQILYRLMPSQEVVFRAAETRILEVSFRLGAQVCRKGDMVCSVVTRRYVVNGERLYDLKDGSGRTLTGVKEEELSLKNNGTFPFVTQME